MDSTGHRLEGQSTSGRNKPEANDKRKKKAYTTTNVVGGDPEALGDVWHAREPDTNARTFSALRQMPGTGELRGSREIAGEIA